MYKCLGEEDIETGDVVLTDLCTSSWRPCFSGDSPGLQLLTATLEAGSTALSIYTFNLKQKVLVYN